MSTSKAQDIVDSWEEIDEDRLASGLRRLVASDTQQSVDESPVLNESGSSSSCTGGSKQKTSGSATRSKANANISLPAMLDEELRPKTILQRPQQMQILRRPQSKPDEEKPLAEAKPKAQIKSLDQRKQEYAEARLRILGSAHDEEEQQQKQLEQIKKPISNVNGFRPTNTANNTSSSNNNNNSSTNLGNSVRYDKPQQQQQQQQQQSGVPAYRGGQSGGSYQLPSVPPHGRVPPPQYASFHSSTGGAPTRPQHPAEASLAAHYFNPQQAVSSGPHPGAYHHGYPHPSSISPLQQHQQPQQQQPPPSSSSSSQKQSLPPYILPPQVAAAYHGHVPSIYGHQQQQSHHHHHLHLHHQGPAPVSSGNSNVLRMPAGPDGSHGFTMRR